MEMAAGIRVPLQLHVAGHGFHVGRGQNVQNLRADRKHKGLPSAERREYDL